MLRPQLKTYCFAACYLLPNAFPGLIWGQQPSEPTPIAAGALISDGELKRLEADADSAPKDLNAQLKLSQRLVETGRYQEAWQRLRNCYAQSPESKGVLLGLQAVMEGYKRQGRLNVGTSAQQVVELLGPPYHTQQMPWGTRRVYGMLALDFHSEKLYQLVKLGGATTEPADAGQVVVVELGSPDWQVGIRQQGDGITTTLLFRDGESIRQWQDLVTIECFSGQAEGKKIDEVLAQVQSKIKADRPDIGFILAEQDESSVIFGVNFPAIEDQPARQQIVRLWLGSRDVHRLAYTHQGPLPTDQEGQKWFRVIKSASLTASTSSGSANSQMPSAREHVKRLAEVLRADIKRANQYRPSEKALSSIAATDAAKTKLQAYCDAVFKELEHAGPIANPNQTEIIVFGPAAEDLPGGYSDIRQHIQASAKFYGFKYVVPGEKLGMSFDGVFEVDGNWYFLPKLHRAFR